MEGLDRFMQLYPSQFENPFPVVSYGLMTATEAFPEAAQAISGWAFDENMLPRDRALGWQALCSLLYRDAWYRPRLSKNTGDHTLYHIIDSDTLDFIMDNGLVISADRNGMPNSNCYYTGLYTTTRPLDMLYFNRLANPDNKFHVLRIDVHKPEDNIQTRIGYGYGPAKVFLHYVEEEIEKSASIGLQDVLARLKEDNDLSVYTQEAGFKVPYAKSAFLTRSMCDLACMIGNIVPQLATKYLGDAANGMKKDPNSKIISSIDPKDVTPYEVKRMLQTMVSQHGFEKCLESFFRRTGICIDDFPEKYKGIMDYFIHDGKDTYLDPLMFPVNFRTYLDDMKISDAHSLAREFQECYLLASRRLYSAHLTKKPLHEIVGPNTVTYGVVIISTDLSEPGYSYNISEVDLGDGSEKHIRELKGIKIVVSESLKK